MEFNPLRDLPMGFGMALVQNEKAMRRFAGMDEAQRRQILDRTGEIKSSSEMKAFVDGISG